MTAELCSLRRALGESLSFVGRYERLFIFCDCAVAVDWANSLSEPSSDYLTVAAIRSMLQSLKSHMKVAISWVPAHVGVPGNEEANTAAQRGAEQVDFKQQYPFQPPVPYKVARAIIKRGIRQCWQEQWILTSLHRFEHDHLSRIKPGVAKSLVFLEGSRAEQTVLARLRLGHCGLAASTSRWSPLFSRICECGCEEETVAHFLLRCPLYSTERGYLMSAVKKIFDGVPTEEILLGAGGIAIEAEDRRSISTAVHKFVLDSKREL